MTPKLKRALAALAPLSPATRTAQALPCKLCARVAPPFDVVDFWKFCAPNGGYNFGLSGVPVTYHRCTGCGFIFTPFFDDWTHQDFARFVYNDDYIKVDGAYAGVRPEKDAETVAQLLEGLPADLRLLDYGSGSGLFGAALQRRGFPNVVSYDPFSQPVAPFGQFDLITLFEVIEHTPHPPEVLRDVARFAAPGAAILFSSGFQPANIATVKASWWYISPRNGHCSIFSTESLALLAEPMGFALRGETGLCALASWPPSAVAAHVTRALPAPLFVRHLHAPAAAAGPARLPGWFAVEPSGLGPFRWSAEPDLVWDLPPPPSQPCRLRLVLPFMMESRPGYAAGCTMSVNGAAVPVVQQDRSLVAELRIDRAQALQVRLHGPPFAPAVSGKRSLGLAIYTA